MATLVALISWHNLTFFIFNHSTSLFKWFVNNIYHIFAFTREIFSSYIS